VIKLDERKILQKWNQLDVHLPLPDAASNVSKQLRLLP